MGLPEVIVDFRTKSTTAIQRSGRGVVALILRDTKTGIKEYRGIDQVKTTDFEPKNVDYIKKAFMGAPYKVLVVAIGTSAEVGTGLDQIKTMRWNYLAMPEHTVDEGTTIATWIKTKRGTDKKTFKAVLSKNVADHEGIINFTSNNIVATGKTYTSAEYTARIAGILAGLSLARSATYVVLPEVESFTEIADMDAAIDAGELILMDDGEKIKIARGVNSLTTFTAEKSQEFSKIKIVEGLDLISDDIRSTFNDQYIGKVINDYNNKMLFVTSVNAYFKALVDEYVLDGSVENRADVDVQSNEQYLNERGVDTSSYTETMLRKANTGSKVFLEAQAKLVDCMEDLFFYINI